MELKDLAPLLLKKERVDGDIDLTVLTNVLRGEKAANDRRKELIKVIEHHPVPSDRDMVYRNHSEHYEFGLKKAFHYAKLLQNGNHTDEEQTILLNALGEQVLLDLHRNMFVPTIETQATDEQRAKWVPLALELSGHRWLRADRIGSRIQCAGYRDNCYVRQCHSRVHN
ncbi:hypothetical protein PI124_g9697 [Phytophthora idaei]|nr:hypothetical protein PI125_g9337 [Phytophthora idaei]KAG3245569.1 hypothetical protein PI124_g9697 [Phytophthora idaei]